MRKKAIEIKIELMEKKILNFKGKKRALAKREGNRLLRS
jgi:hypothetical protein